MKRRIMAFIGFMFGLFSGYALPNENEQSTFLMHDHKADGPVSYPGGLLTGLSGIKEREDFEEATRKLEERFNGIKRELKADLEREVAQRIASQYSGGHSGSSGMKERREAVERDLVAHYMRTGTISGEKAQELAGLSGKKATDFTVTDNSFVVPDVVDQAILQVMRSQSTLLGRVHVASAGSGYNKLIMRDGSSGRVLETSERALVDAPLASRVAYTGGEVYSRFAVSQWAIDDAGYDLASELMNSVGEEFARLLEGEVVSGGGTTEFTGLNEIADAANPTFGQLRRILKSVAGVTYDDLLATVLSVPKRYRPGSTWIVSPTTLAEFITLEDANGNLIFQPALNDQDTGMLLGYPVEESEEIEAGRIAYFGNLQRGYSVHFITGSRVIRDPYTRKGFVEFYVSRRVRGALADSTGLSVLVGSAS